MSKQHKQILALLKSRGRMGAYNSELQNIAHRFGARVKELTDGDYDGTAYPISVKRISKGVFKYTLMQDDLDPEQVMSLLTKPEQSQPTITPEIAREKWEQARSLFQVNKPYSAKEAYEKKVNEFKEKLMVAESWIEANADRMTAEAMETALSKRDLIENTLNYYQTMLGEHEN